MSRAAGMRLREPYDVIPADLSMVDGPPLSPPHAASTMKVLLKINS